MNTVPGNCTPLGWQTTEGSPGLTWQAWGGSFLLLPRRHALSSRWLWTFNHNTCENSLEEVQGSVTSPLFRPPLSKHVAMCTALVCGVQCSMPARLGHWQSQTSSVCSKMTGQWSDNVRPQDIVTTRSNELLVRLDIEDLDLILKERRLRWYGHVERSNGAIKTAFEYRLMESVGLGGPKWHGSSWQRGIADSGSSRLSTLMIDVPGDLVWDLPCVQQASYLEGGPLMWMLPLYLHVNQKSDYDMKVPCEAWWFHSHLKS